MSLKTFWNYYGGKWRLAPSYPAPRHKTIIEPFAGAAGYSLRHYKHNVILFDSDPAIVRIWKWLIEEATPESVLRLPVIGEFENVDQIDAPAGAKDLIGFCVNAGSSQPCKSPSRWARSRPDASWFWSPTRRQRVAEQVPMVKHWQVYLGQYSQAPDIEATWFIDPPYAGKQGSFYHHGSSGISYDHLAKWCLARKGQTMVCEAEGANWLPFAPFMRSRATPKHGGRYSAEALYTFDA